VANYPLLTCPISRVEGHLPGREATVGFISPYRSQSFSSLQDRLAKINKARAYAQVETGPKTPSPV
jgi:hypothetical protein